MAILLLVNVSFDPICHRNGLTEGGSILHDHCIINLAMLIKAVVKNINDGYTLKPSDAILYFVEQPFGYSHLKLTFGHSLACMLDVIRFSTLYVLSFALCSCYAACVSCYC
eukprot:8136774-Ditylum_brightwellii.AAC.1